MKYAPALALAVVVTACGGDKSSDAKAPPAPVTALTAVDAGAEVDAGIIELPTRDPDDGFALDPDPIVRPGNRVAGRDRRMVQLLLRSTPPGAVAAVDGVRVGPTPIVWDGEAGAAHEFTFVLPGHTLARYRFIALSDGVVHGRLMRITSDTEPPEVPTPIAPIAPARPAPRPVPPRPAPPPIDAAPAIDASVDGAALVPVGPTP